MPTLYIRNVDEQTYKRLKTRARRSRRSISQEAATIITDTLADGDEEKAWEAVERLGEEMAERYGSLPDSTPIMRADRNR